VGVFSLHSVYAVVLRYRWETVYSTWSDP